MATPTVPPGSAPANAVSRRGIIGALAAAPVLAGSLAVPATVGAAAQGTEAMNMYTSVAPTDRRVWDSAWAEYQRLNKTWLAHPYARTRPSDPDYDRLHEEESVLMDAACDALAVVMKMPAPDHAALANKLSLYIREFEDISEEGFLTTMVGDMRRLGNVTAR